MSASSPASPSSPPDPTSNPFLTARAEFENVFTNLARARRNWQLVAFVSLGLLAVRVLQDGYVTVTSRVTPYVVEVDRFGRAQAFGPAEPLKATDQRIIIAQLSGFIRNVRTVLSDAPAQADMMRAAYAYVAPSAAGTLNTYFSQPENDPRVVGQQLTRQVEVTSVLQLPGTATWKIQWIETDTFLRGGAPTRISAWEAYVGTRIVPPKTTETLQLNPLGLYVTSINWTRAGTQDLPVGP